MQGPHEEPNHIYFRCTYSEDSVDGELAVFTFSNGAFRRQATQRTLPASNLVSNTEVNGPN